MLESTLVNKIRKKLRSLFPNILVIKIHGGLFQVAGLPDLLICYKGKFIGLEVKVPGKEKTLTALQKKWLKSIRRAGGLSYMVTSTEMAVSAVRKVDKNSLN